MVAENLRTQNILGYGTPNYDLMEKLNGISTAKQTAYTLPNSQSATVWETWKNDELQVLCEDGDYYLVLYPYVYSGKFVAAYVPKSTVEITSSVSTSDEFYSINKLGKITTDTNVYHNASDDDLMNGATNYKIRARLCANDIVSVLFAENDFYFIKTNDVSGYISKSAISFDENDDNPPLLGDINNDLKIDSADAGMILRYDVGLIDLSANQMQCANLNNDFRIDSADAGMILRYDAGIIQGFN